MVQADNPNDLSGPEGASNFTWKIEEGSKVKLKNGAIAEVTGNPQDGSWLLLKYLEHPENPSQVGEEEMVFFVDVQSVV